MPFSPTDLSSLAGWYDADDASTFSYSSGVSVSQWRDKSGLNRHFAQATSSLQPQRNGNQNGRTSLVFDGVDDYMDTAAFTQAQPITVFIAINPNVDHEQGWFSSVGGNFQTYMGEDRFCWYAGNNLTLVFPIPFNVPSVYGVEYNGASSKVYLDGTLKSSANPGTTGTTTGWRLSERNLAPFYRLSGDLFEVIVYSRILTSPERISVEDYLTAKWITAPPNDFTGWGFPI